jgi:type II secretory pathway pseudopilin PulG
MSSSDRYTHAPDQVVAAATGTVAAGVLLTTLPLRSIFTDWAWLVVSVGCVLPYLAVVALFRMRSAASWWHSLVGLGASVLMVLWVFVPQHLLVGVLPTPSSLTDISDLIRSANTVMQQENAPLASTGPLRLLVASALVALVALTDVLAVQLRRPLLAAAPLLEVLAIASATSSKAAHPVWFAAAAGGFLLILLSGTRLQDRAWGPSVDGSAGRLGGARRMAVAGVVAALIVPLLLPSVSVNVLAQATHHNGNGSGPGGGQIVLNGFAKLRGSLKRPVPVQLFQVRADNERSFYVRQEVADQYVNEGWQASPRKIDGLTPLAQTNFPIAPSEQSDPGRTAFSYNATFTMLALGGSTLPLLANPSDLRATGRGQQVPTGNWNSATASVVNASVQRGMSYTEVVSQPNPSVATLRDAQPWTRGDQSLDDRYLGLPEMPASVHQLADTLTAKLTSPYDKAKAISDYFTDGRNGFKYSLDAVTKDSPDALVAFLQNKEGFCQQYAAAAAVLMRLANLPTRVVIGYTHRQPDTNGLFTVLTSDAHAWVEVYFPTVGWIPFDPTPLVGAEAGRARQLPWAPHPVAASEQTKEPTANRGLSASASATAHQSDQANQGSASSILSARTVEIAVLVLLAIALILALVFGPQWVRKRQRRRRLERARATGNPEPLWLELAATATDRDALWPSTVTVGQVPGWLSQHGVDARGRAAVTAVADRVEQDRFSAHRVEEVPADSVAALDQALTRWARRTDRRLSLLHRWLPRSLISRQPRWRR